MAGAYLFRLLKENGYEDVDVYDVPSSTRCGRRPCAWGFAPSSEYRRLVSRFADPERFILQQLDSITIDGVKLKADMLTVDKPALQGELLSGVEVSLSPLDQGSYDRIVDATGVARAYLGPVDGPELVAECVQYRVSSPEPPGLWFNTSSIGYEWCFPLGGNEFHLGFGNLRSGVEDYRPSIEVPPREGSVRCRCRSRIRMSSPYHSQPFVVDQRIVGVGESIGTVGPLGGDGNLYAMQCAELLMENWDDLDAYAQEVLSRYAWMRKERVALDKLRRGRLPSPLDTRTFLQHTQRVGIEMSMGQALSWFRKALQ